MKTDSAPPGERCYGVDIAEDGALVVAEYSNGRTGSAVRYPAGDEGVSAVREHIGRDTARPRICICSCGAVALTVAMGLAPLPRVEVTLVAPRVIEASSRAGRESAPASPEERAQQLARLAERLI
jgi:hypothetical protein